MLNGFEQWMPFEAPGGDFDIAFLGWKPEGLVCALEPGGSLIWESSDVVCYQLTDETYRADCWAADFEKSGRFYRTNDSEYLNMMRRKSPLFPENTAHYLMIGTNFVADVLAKAPPRVV